MADELSTESHFERKLPVHLCVGTHTWAAAVESELMQDEIISLMQKYNITRLDTARSYGLGASEAIIGKRGLASYLTITTKAPTGEGRGAAKGKIYSKLVERVHVYMLHAPDETVPVEDTMNAIQTLYQEGRFDKFGLSNFDREGVLEFYNYAKAKGFILPTVFQSSYSLAVRLNEMSLFPTLRDLGMSIQAYSPMAAGLLTKTRDEIEHATGRWDPTTLSGAVHRRLFYKPSYFKMLEEYGKISEKSGVSRMGLAYRWVRYHSALDGTLDDEMIIGASSGAQFRKTLEEIDKGPLEAWVAKELNDLWELVKADAPVDNLKAVREIVYNY